MKNRAKCNLCKDIIQSFHATDLVSCRCGEISIDGGDYQYKCFAKDFINFLRVDDLGNEIIVKIQSQMKDNNSEKVVEKIESKYKHRPDKKELLKLLEIMIENIESLPSQAMQTYVNQYDLCSALMLISELFKEISREDV